MHLDSPESRETKPVRLSGLSPSASLLALCAALPTAARATNFLFCLLNFPPPCPILQEGRRSGPAGARPASSRPGECVRGPGRVGGRPLPQPQGDPRCFPLQGVGTLRKGARCARARRAQAGMESYRPELSAGGASGTVGAAAAELRERQVSFESQEEDKGKERTIRTMDSSQKNGQMKKGRALTGNSVVRNQRPPEL